LRLDRDRLIRAREMLGYGIETTARAAGVSKNSVLRAEHGDDIRPATARKIAKALNVEVADLYGEREYPKGEAPPWPEPSFNDVIEERRFFRFADAFDAAADRWISKISGSAASDGELAGLVSAALDLYEFISGHVSRQTWEALTTEEQAELSRIMDKLALVATDGLLRLKRSGYLDEQQAARRREMMREWTNRTSAQKKEPRHHATAPSSPTPNPMGVYTNDSKG
jgi:DNA-binding XRE family transcriptional regulator